VYDLPASIGIRVQQRMRQGAGRCLEGLQHYSHPLNLLLGEFSGLVQVQQTQMGNQDEELQQLSKLLQRQRVMGEQIHQEIGQQNEILDEVDSEVGRVGNKLGKAKRQMNRLN